VIKQNRVGDIIKTEIKQLVSGNRMQEFNFFPK